MEVSDSDCMRDTKGSKLHGNRMRHDLPSRTRVETVNLELLDQLFHSVETAKRLALDLGFRSLSEAEAFCVSHSVISSAPTMDVASRKHNVGIVDDFHPSSRRSSKKRTTSQTAYLPRGSIVLANSPLNGNAHQNISEKENLSEHSCGSQDSTSGGPNPCSCQAVLALRLEMARLYEQYDSLALQKARAAERYKKDYQKWRSFKTWLLEHNASARKKMCEEESHVSVECSDTAAANVAEFGSKFHTENQAGGNELDRALDTSCSSISSSSSSRPLKRARNEGRPEVEHLHLSLMDNQTTTPHTSFGGKAGLARPNVENTSCRSSGNVSERSTSINAHYEINKAGNEGLNFQFDDVVRKMADRRKLEAGDCECCREYYEALGPHPEGLQRPQWDTSSTSLRPHKFAHTCGWDTQAGDSVPAGNADCSQERIEQHVKNISRHRYQWDRSNTPPGYWDIGFPTTQEALGINERANEMHGRKMEMVRLEASKTNGKYIRRNDDKGKQGKQGNEDE